MKNQLYKDKNKRRLYNEIEKKQIILKSIIKNNNLTKPTRWNSEFKLSKINKTKFKSQLVKRCLLTGRKGKFNEMFRFSRLSFLKLVRNGYLSGFKKSAR